MNSFYGWTHVSWKKRIEVGGFKSLYFFLFCGVMFTVESDFLNFMTRKWKQIDIQTCLGGCQSKKTKQRSHNLNCIPNFKKHLCNRYNFMNYNKQTNVLNVHFVCKSLKWVFRNDKFYEVNSLLEWIVLWNYELVFWNK